MIARTPTQDTGRSRPMGRMFSNGRDPFPWIWSHHIDWDTPVTAEPVGRERVA